MRLTQCPAQVDVLIAGGGPVGALLAQMLMQAGVDVLIADARKSAPADPRALALSADAIATLQTGGLWNDQLPATPIRRVHVSQAGTLGRAELSADDLGLPELGAVVPYQPLAQCALEKLANGPVRLAAGVRVSKVRQLDRYASVTLEDGQNEKLITCRLLILADGGSLLEQLGDIRQTIKPYDQEAILTTLTPVTPHQHIAYERFSDNGPMALLPNGLDFTLVWTQTPEGAREKLALSDTDFISAVAERFAGRVDGFSAVGKRASWPLALKTVDSVTGKRVVLVGNAAQTLHPVAGQGLNLGLRDAVTLAHLISQTPRQQLGETAMLARYTQLRQRDAGLVTHFTDSLIHLFDNANPALKHARSLGLLAVDQIAPFRRAFTRRMVYGAR